MLADDKKIAQSSKMHTAYRQCLRQSGYKQHGGIFSSLAAHIRSLEYQLKHKKPIQNTAQSQWQ